MRCKDAQEMMTAWIDGELLPDKKMDLEFHLVSCRTCSAQAQYLRHLTCLLDTHPSALPSAKLRKKTLSLFIKETAPERADHWWSGLGWEMQTTMAASALIGLGIGCNLGAGWASTQLLTQYSISGFLFSAGGLLLSWA